MRQEFYDLAKKIADWHTVTFKDADKAGQLLKLARGFDIDGFDYTREGMMRIAKEALKGGEK